MTEDDDDIAYIGDEDDGRGPGCLIGIATACGGFGFLGFVALLIWLVSIDAFSGRGNVSPDPLFMAFMVLVAFLSVLTSSFGLGLGLFAETKARLASNPNQMRVLARIATALGGTAVVGIVVLAMILVAGFRR